MKEYMNDPTSSLLCSYFHRNWHDEHDSIGGVIAAFYRDNTDQCVSDAQSGLKELVRLPNDDLQMIIGGLGPSAFSDFLVSGDLNNERHDLDLCRQWIVDVLQLLERQFR